MQAARVEGRWRGAWVKACGIHEAQYNCFRVAVFRPCSETGPVNVHLWLPLFVTTIGPIFATTYQPISTWALSSPLVSPTTVIVDGQRAPSPRSSPSPRSPIGVCSVYRQWQESS
jgi:hypothetical protein